MEYTRNNLKVVILAIAVAVVGIAMVSAQQVQNLFKKAAADGKAIRVSEANACDSNTNADAPHFSGCSSII